MDFEVTTGDLAKLKTECLILGVFAEAKLSGPAALVDRASGGRLSDILKRGDLGEDIGRTLMLYDLPGIRAERVLLVGCGPAKELSRANQRKAVAAAIAVADLGHPSEVLCTLPDLVPAGSDTYRATRDTLLAAAEQTYRFERTKSAPKPLKRPLSRLRLWVADKAAAKAAKRATAHGEAIAKGVVLARDLGNLPGNLCTPSYLAGQAETLGQRFPKLQVEILEQETMEQLGMGALLSVARGSRQPPKLILMTYRGGQSDDKPVVLVGKGLTFDAGGISIKPAEKMDEMKFDMCGGASVFGTLLASLELGLPLNLIGVVPASENLPDGAANKPGDVVTSLSGQTIEVLNTDAEGRLILCDALTYSERFDPAVVIDIATLTGACVVALGNHPSGLLSNDEGLASEVLEAGDHSGDRAWRLPLWDDYQNQLDSNFADMANVGGREAGAITAACFLARYTKKMRWAHLDIAGTAWRSGKEKGATGRPVPLLTQFLLKRAGLVD
jgi:leucyl aminopeptidase